jgi:hypothetical protein
MRRLTAGIALALLLSAAGAASAKLPGPGLRFCGLVSCRTISDPDLLSQIGLVLNGTDRPLSRPPVPGPFYTVDWVESGWPVAHYVHAAGLVRIERVELVEWYPLRAAQSVFEDAVRGVIPLPSPQVVRVDVGRRRARAPMSYLRLYQLLVNGERVSDPLGPRPALEWQNYKALVRYYDRDRRLWIPIRVRTVSPSPWSDEAAQLSIGRRHDLLRGDGTVVRVPEALAARVRRGLSP